MRYRLLLKIFGFLLLFLSVAMTLPLLFVFYYGEDPFPFITSIGITVTFGAFALVGPKKRREELRAKEGFAVVTLGWLFISIFGSLPYFLSGEITSFTDCFFETISGFTTTGGTILEDIESISKGLLFWRSLTHWIGGMGIIVLSIAILPFLGVGGMQLFKAETPGPIADRLSPRITETAKLLWVVYFVFTLVETVLLLFGGMSFFDAINHSLATMATGGFSTKNASIAHYNSAYIEYIIILFMFLAGCSFTLHFNFFFKFDLKAPLRNKEFLFFTSIIICTTTIIVFDLHSIGTIDDVKNGIQDNEFLNSIRIALFQVIAIITTTGFGTSDYELWSPSSQIILFTLMFMGGCSGSTSGGMKVIRIFLLVQFSYKELKKLLHPKAVFPIRFNGRIIDKNIIYNIAGFFVVYCMIAVFSVWLLSLLGLDFETSFGAVAANISNIGPGLGMVGPTDNYASLPDTAKWILSLLMLVGRLEIYTVIILLTTFFWKK